MSKTGYFGVVVPEKDLWQCFYLDDSFRDNAVSELGRMRGDTTLANASKVITRLEVAGTDQPILGNFCATIIEATLAASGYPTETSFPHAESLIGTHSYAIREIIGRPYFWIEGRYEGGGIYSTIQPIYVSSIAQARTYINGMPQVRKIKRRVLAAGAELNLREAPAVRSASIEKRYPAIDQMITAINAQMPSRKR